MNRLERLVRIDRLLQQQRPVPMRRFIAELGASRSTITRDFEYLRDFLDAPIVYDADANGHHYDPEDDRFELPGLWFNQSELYALLATEQLLEAAQPGLLAPYFGPLKARIRKLLGQAGVSAETLGQRIRLLDHGRRDLDSQAFGTIAEAVLSRRVLDIDYHGRAADRRSDRTVHPQRLAHYRANWYLLAHCESAGDLRLFSLDRIRSATLRSETAQEVAPKVVDRWLGASFGIFTGTAYAWAMLRFSASAARWVAEERWHPDQIGVWLGDAYELQVPYADATELVMEILRYGPDVEVVGPPDLRARVAERLREAAAIY
jgi:predicted DNA-binding transcriptional regulator YafY